jgi:hypothetical protein
MIHLNIKKIKCVNFLGFSFTAFVASFCFGTKSTIYTHDLKDFNKAFPFNDGQFASPKIIFEK